MQFTYSLQTIQIIVTGKKMSLILLDGIDYTFPYEWKCSEKGVLNRLNIKAFWENVQKKIISGESEVHLLKNSYYHLSNHCGGVLQIGVSPQIQFKVMAQLVIKATNYSIMMDSKHLLDFLKDIDSHMNQKNGQW